MIGTGGRKRSISVEVTNIINPDLKREEAIEDSIISNACQLFKNKYPKVKLVVYFSVIRYYMPNRKKDIDDLSLKIFNFIESIFLKNKNYEFYVKIKNLPFNCIEKITINNERNFSNWQSHGAHLVPYIDKNTLFKQIQGKEDLIKKYKKKVDEKWLLMISDYGRKSSSHRFEHINIKTSKFDKIFIFGWRSKEVIRVYE